jgi:hypothetical protein
VPVIARLATSDRPVAAGGRKDHNASGEHTRHRDRDHAVVTITPILASGEHTRHRDRDHAVVRRGRFYKQGFEYKTEKCSDRGTNMLRPWHQKTKNFNLL